MFIFVRLFDNQHYGKIHQRMKPSRYRPEMIQVTIPHHPLDFFFFCVGEFVPQSVSVSNITGKVLAFDDMFMIHVGHNHKEKGKTERVTVTFRILLADWRYINKYLPQASLPFIRLVINLGLDDLDIESR